MDTDAALMDAWRPLAEKALRGAPLASLDTVTPDGLVLHPLYGPAPPSRLGRPRHGPWQRVAVVGDAGPEQVLDDLANGADALALCTTGVVRAGLLVRDRDSLDASFAGVMLDLVPLHIDFRAGALALFALVAALAEQRGTLPAALHVGIDPTALAFDGDQPLPDGIGSRLASAAHGFRALGVSGTLFSGDGRRAAAAGAAPSTELAVALHSAATVLRLLDTAGMPPADALPLVALRLCATHDQFATMAKLRAARRLHRLLATACGVDLPLALHVTTARTTLSIADPESDLLRLTIAAFAAGVGGADSVTLDMPLPWDLRFTQRMSRNIQSLLIEEAHVARLDDPAAGAGAIEALTDAIAEAAWALFQELEGAADPREHVRRRIASDIAAADAMRQADRAPPISATTLTAEQVEARPRARFLPTAHVVTPASDAFADLLAAARMGATMDDLTQAAPVALVPRLWRDLRPLGRYP